MTEDISIYTYEFVLLLLNYFSSHTRSTKHYFLKHEKQDSEDDAKVVGLTEKMAILCTVWKFHNFSIRQILREINFWDSRSAKSAILTH